MDDVCKSAHSVDDKKSAKALGDRLASCASNPHFQGRGNAFCVKHYAGDVTYELSGMAEKNKDTLFKDLLECISISQNKYLKDLFAEDCSNKGNPTTAGFKIRVRLTSPRLSTPLAHSLGCDHTQTQANALVTTLSKAMPHYVRCLKPNDLKMPREYDQKRVLHQIRYLGLLDNVKVRRAGFAYRTTFHKFLHRYVLGELRGIERERERETARSLKVDTRYFLLSGQTSYAAKMIWKGDDISGCRAILSDAPFATDQWQIGKTKVFIRAPESVCEQSFSLSLSLSLSLSWSWSWS